MKTTVVHRIYLFLLFTIKNYIRNDCTHRASSLTITTLLTLVPLLTLLFGLVTLLPYFDQLLQPIQHFIFSHFLPGSGETLQAYLLNFVDKASQFSLLSGLAMLIYSVLLIYNIELAFNKIWHVTHSRKLFHALLVYLAILLIIPIFLGVSLFVNMYIKSIVIFSSEYVVQKNILLSYAPFFLSWMTFSFLYYFVPNTRVKFTHAQLSALLTTVLFEIMKEGFALYLSYFKFYEMIYGVFAIIPVFILWIELIWLLILFCVEINYSISIYGKKS